MNGIELRERIMSGDRSCFGILRAYSTYCTEIGSKLFCTLIFGLQTRAQKEEHFVAT